MVGLKKTQLELMQMIRWYVARSCNGNWVIIGQPDTCGNMTRDLQQFPDVTLPGSEERALTAEEFYLPLQAICARTPCPSQLSTVILLFVSLIGKQDQDFDVLSFTFLVLQGSFPKKYFQRYCNILSESLSFSLHASFKSWAHIFKCFLEGGRTGTMW